MSTKGLKLAQDLILPLEAITQTFGVLAVRGGGKSNLAAVMAEEMYAAKLPFVVVDPVGAWWGLRSSGDGESPGLSIPIFGGAHGDIPLEKAAGQLIADLVVQDRLSCVLDVADFSEGDKIRFLIDFAERLYRKNQDPLHLFLEEADDYAPQRPFRDQARLLRAWENIVRRGRGRGLGITMITQRSAALNKNVLTQIETLFVLRTTSPQDRKAIAGWVEYHGQGVELLESLPGLESGVAWAWSPSWLRILKRVHVRRRWTFDSGATPKNIRSTRPPATLADVDLGILSKRMAATIERAKAEDPRELRLQIQRLERDLAAARKVPLPVPAPERLEIPVLKDSQLRGIEILAEKLEKPALRLAEVAAIIGSAVSGLRESLARLNRCAGRAVATASSASPRQAGPVRAAPPRRQSSIEPRPAGTTAVSRAQRRILNALAWLETVGLERAHKTQVALLADQSPTSGGYFNNLGVLRSAGLIEYPSPAAVALTDLGRNMAEPVDVPQTSEEIHRQLFARLSSSQARILQALIAAYPDDLAKAELAERSGQSATSGGYFNNLGRLRSLGLIDYPRPGVVVALPVLFLDQAQR